MQLLVGIVVNAGFCTDAWEVHIDTVARKSFAFAFGWLEEVLVLWC